MLQEEGRAHVSLLFADIRSRGKSPEQPEAKEPGKEMEEQAGVLEQTGVRRICVLLKDIIRGMCTYGGWTTLLGNFQTPFPENPRSIGPIPCLSLEWFGWRARRCPQKQNQPCALQVRKLWQLVEHPLLIARSFQHPLYLHEIGLDALCCRDWKRCHTGLLLCAPWCDHVNVGQVSGDPRLSS